MRIKSIKNIKQLKDKYVLVRCDFNVPIKNGTILDGFKIKKSLPTIEYLLTKGAKIILVSHLGRPDGKVVPKLSLKPVRDYLENVLARKIGIFNLSSRGVTNSDVAMLENIRFYQGEEKNSDDLAKQLSSLADYFVLDGFGVAHRASASVSGVAKYLPTFA